MKTITTSDFSNKESFINKSLQENEYVLLTNKENKAIGLFSSLSDELFEYGFVQWFGIKAFKNGDLTLRQLAGLLKKDIDQTIALLNTFSIPIIDYDFNEDIETLKDL